MTMKRFVLVCLALLCLAAVPASATTYTSYTYDARSRVVKTPAPYTPVAQLSGHDLGVGDFSNPSDIYTDFRGLIYICDSGNNRIVCLNSDLTLNRVITSFRDGYFTGNFANPSGVFVDRNTGILYICDTDNARVIGLDENDSMVKRFNRPEQVNLFAEDQIFAPIKVAVDNGGRVFIVSRDVYEGLMQYDSAGNFLGYVGANEVAISPLNYLWKKISTKAQSAKMQLTLPTEFSNLEIDEDGFIYTTTSIINTQNTNILVRRQNPSGDDVLHRSATLRIAGDVIYDEYSSETVAGPSNFVDVTVNGNGMYSLLDSKRGRIFTYDFDGNLLYLFGGNGNEGNDVGCFYTPSSMIKFGERYAVLDLTTGTLTIFDPTEYGDLINRAVADNYNGRYEEAAALWKQVLRLNANYEQAYTGIGIAQLRSGDYEAAMKSFRLGVDRTYYSKAFKLYRQNWLERNFVWIAVGVVLAVVALCVALTISERHRAARRRVAVTGTFRFALYAVGHPFDGFFVMKREKRGSLKLSIGILAVLVLGSLTARQMTGFLINTADPNEISLIDEAAKVLGVFFLFCIINWCVTALMDGEGRLRDIICCTATCMIPLTVSIFPLTALSNVLTLEDMAFYYAIYAIVILYTGFLLIVGVMETHQYTFLKTLGVLLITLLGMVVVVFLAMLFVNLINTMYDFLIKMYNEVVMR